MKKLFTLIAASLIAVSGISQSVLPNGDFEDWSPNPNHGFYEPDGGFFFTLNLLDTIPTPPGITVYPTDTAYTGNKAARLITRKIDLLEILIPGVIGTLQIDWANNKAILGHPYMWTTKPERFQGHYMAFPLNGDSIGAILLLSKWNSATMQRDTIAYTRLIFQGTVDTYTEFDAPIEYWDNTTMPDSITLLLLSCGGYNASNMFGSVGQVGSQAFFDDVTLTNVSGIDMLLMPDVNVKLAPNPAHDKMTVTLSELIKTGIFEVINTQGKILRKYNLNSTSETFDVSSLPAGMYYYRVTDGAKKLSTGSFLIVK
jgi:hypothetical protein